MAVQLISKAAYARHRGCDEKAVRKAIAEGRISCVDGKVDPAVADIQWEQNTRARAGSSRPAAPSGKSEGGGGQNAAGAAAAVDARTLPATSPVEPGYQDFRTRREKAEAERAERENEKEAGRLVERDLVERAVFDAFRQLRDAVIAASPRSAPKLVGVADVREIERVITDELRKAFQGWEERMLERLPARERA